MHGPRAQIDRKLYKKSVQNELLNTPNLDIYCSSVEDLLLSDLNGNFDEDSSKAVKKCDGIVLKDGTRISAKTVIITTGTFLRGQINIGKFWNFFPFVSACSFDSIFCP